VIIGNGLLASALAPFFASDDDTIVFASGVSNSRETRHEEFERERRMLQQTLDQSRLLVYFSTCSICDPELKDSAYVRHKIAMELMVSSAKRYAIFRLPQVVGKTDNHHTLTNYLHQSIVSGNPFTVWLNARRNLIDADDVAAIVHCLIKSHRVSQGTLNVASPLSTSIAELVEAFEKIIGTQANCNSVPMGGAYTIEADMAHAVALEVGVVFDAHYVTRLIRKYYGKQ